MIVKTISKIAVIILTMICFSYKSFSQYPYLTETTYLSFNGIKNDVYLMEGKYTVFQFSKDLLKKDQLNDVETLNKIRDEIDGYYLGFKTLFGVEPSGGNQKYGLKANVFFGSPSCGAACGLLGAKGIEVGGTYLGNIFNEIKSENNLHRIGLVGYEFGRNFFTIGDKILFPYDLNKNERNGGFAEGFANLGQLESFNSFVLPNFSNKRKNFQETSMYHKNLKKLFLAYINDLTKNPLNCMLVENQIQDYNRNQWRLDIPSYIASGILVGIYNLFDKPDLKNFILAVNSRGKATSVEYALGTIALGFSKTLNLDLNNFFINVLRFKIDKIAQNEISLLPKIGKDKLIKDIDEIYFATPLDSIQLNVRSISYDSTNLKVKYKIEVDGKIISITSHGNNSLPYSILGDKSNIKLKISLVNNEIEQDFYFLTLKNRSKFEFQDISSNSWLSSSNGTGRAEINGAEITIENVSTNSGFIQKDHNYLQFSYPLIKNRILRLSGEIKNKSLIKNESWSNFVIGGRWGSHGTGRVGYDVGKENEVDFFKADLTFNTSMDYFLKSFNQSGSNYLEMNFRIESVNSNAIFKNFKIEDLTDMDDDGIIDFEDDCPTIKNPLTPSIIKVNEFDLKTSNQIVGESYQWYLEGQAISGGTASTLKASVPGNYTVQTKNSNGCKSPKSTALTMLILGKEKENNGVVIYPNPFSSTVKITFDKEFGDFVLVSIFDIKGSLILNKNSVSLNENIDLSGLSEGIYMVKIKSHNNQNSKMIKVIKQFN